MELDEGEIRDDTSSGPQTHIAGLDDTPTFHYRPKQKQVATLWVRAQFVHYELQTHRRLYLQYYMDFLKRERWEASHAENKRPNTGHYVDVLYSYNQQWKTSSLLTCLEKSRIPYRN
jgi:hypothetical protein